MLLLVVLFTWRALSEINECRKSRPIVQIGDPSLSRAPRYFLLPTAYLTKLWNLWDIVTLVLLFVHITIHSVIMQELNSLEIGDRWTQSTRFDEQILITASALSWARSIAALNLVFCTL